MQVITLTLVQLVALAAPADVAEPRRPLRGHRLQTGKSEVNSIGGRAKAR